MPPKILPIVLHPDKRLRQKCKPITKADQHTRQLILNMGKTMLEKDGIGLAAPQVGELICLIVINTKDGVLPMINPKITKKSWLKENGEEGCLSIPDFYAPVKRHKGIHVIFEDVDGKKHRLDADGLFARVIQHEIDHLNGILFIDYLKKKDIPKKYQG